MEDVYNRQRLHTSLDMVPPVEFEYALMHGTEIDNGILTPRV